ncbi:MAG: hypothetical protein HYY02_09330 [Chloroflexi bacterium]|nr:hypothetical protein [Chloroflexota bacterium]
MSTSQFPFSLMATGIGSMPHTDAGEAAAAVVRALPNLPAWPQLVRSSPLEGMAAQFAEGITGVRMEEDQVIQEGTPGEHDYPTLSPERAAGFFALLQQDLTGVRGLKGQVTGALTFSYQVALESGRPAMADMRVARRYAQLLGRVGEWQESQLRKHTRNVLIFFDEPMLDQALADPKVGPTVTMDILSSVVVWLRARTGLHCCAAPRWDFLTRLPYHVLSFDTYRYGETTEMAVAPLRDFLSRGGAIAWGVVPTNSDELARESVEGLEGLLERTWGRLVDLGIPRALLERQALITPACGLANLTPQEAEAALAMASGVAARLRARAGLA